MTPLVSVIVPCYNAGEYLNDSINSVIGQSYQNWELLIIDDCSTDNSAQIIQRFTECDSRIKSFKTLNKSGSPSLPRNIGIDNANGKYIAFLDADDIWMPDKLKKQVEWMESSGLVFGYSFYEKIDFNGNKSNRIVKTRKTSTYQSLLKSNAIPCLTSILERKAIGNTRFKPIQQEDFCFWLDILKKGYCAHNLCEVTAYYREAPDSRSANKIRMFREHWRVIRNHHHINLLLACYYMITYTISGLIKYMK
ncbi:MAG: glycosyltransferase family 2 protein [Bacteroides sp.]|nr:glycosyltransferase family 2 protein [Bacteroides sp.]